MDVRELITLQIGHYANFVGSHWWNIQEAGFCYDKSSSTDINHDFLYREGNLSKHQLSYTPRLLVVDAKGSLGSLPVQGTLYNSMDDAPSTSQALWSDGVDLIHQIPEEKNEFLKALEEEDEIGQCVEDRDKESKNVPFVKKKFDLSPNVKVWSDFLRIHYHPRTTVVLNEIEHQDECRSGGFQNGAQVMKREDVEDEITDRIRLLAEGCGSLQGFNLLADVQNEMAGVAWKIAEYLADEFDRKDIMSFLATPPHLKPVDGNERKVFLTSIIQAYSELSKVSSMVIPLNLRRHSWHSWEEGVRWDHVTPNLNCPYESSAILASFIDSATMHMRTKTKPLSMNHLAQLLTPSLRKFVGGSLSIPLGMSSDCYFSDFLYGNTATELFGMQSVSCGFKFSSGDLSQAISLRGVPATKIIQPQMNLPYNVKINDVKDMFEYYTSVRYENRHQYNTCISDQQSTSTPFPLFFDKSINENGFLTSNKIIDNNEAGVKSIPVASGLYQGDGMKFILENILHDGKLFDPSRIARLKDEEMNWPETLEEFSNIVKNYSC